MACIDQTQALMRIQPEMLEQLLFPRLDPKTQARPVARGLPASPGAASGIAVFDADRAEKLGRGGETVILVREETKPEDIHGFFASPGHPHQPRRQDLARRRGRPRHGQALRRRCRGHPRRRAHAPGRRRRPGVRRGRPHHHRRHHRQRLPRRSADDRGGFHARAGHAAVVGRRAWPGSRSWPTPTPRTTPSARSSSVPWASACAAPSACSTTVERLPIVVEMIVAETTGRSSGGARQAAADPARGLQGHLQGHGAAPGHHPPARPADP